MVQDWWCITEPSNKPHLLNHSKNWNWKRQEKLTGWFIDFHQTMFYSGQTGSNTQTQRHTTNMTIAIVSHPSVNQNSWLTFSIYNYFFSHSSEKIPNSILLTSIMPVTLSYPETETETETNRVQGELVQTSFVGTVGPVTCSPRSQWRKCRRERSSWFRNTATLSSVKWKSLSFTDTQRNRQELILICTFLVQY